MTYRITAAEEDEIDQAFNDRDAARANARRLRAALDEANKKIESLERRNEELLRQVQFFNPLAR